MKVGVVLLNVPAEDDSAESHVNPSQWGCLILCLFALLEYGGRPKRETTRRWFWHLTINQLADAFTLQPRNQSTLMCIPQTNV